MSAGVPPRSPIPNVAALETRIETARLTLRPFVASDVEAVWPIVSDPEFPRLMSWAAHTERQQTVDFVEQLRKAHASGKAIAWAIVHAGQLVGMISLDDIRWQLRAWRIDRAEVGYWLAKQHWNRGFITEATTAVVRYAFDVIGLHKLTTGCLEQNLGSRRVIEKVGFRLVGRRDEEMWRDDQWHAFLEFEMLAHEFPDVHATTRMARPELS